MNYEAEMPRKGPKMNVHTIASAMLLAFLAAGCATTPSKEAESAAKLIVWGQGEPKTERGKEALRQFALSLDKHFTEDELNDLVAIFSDDEVRQLAANISKDSMALSRRMSELSKTDVINRLSALEFRQLLRGCD